MSKVTDSYTCYKVVRADILKGFELKAMGFEIEAEITSELLSRGIKINEVPIKYTPRTKAEGKKIKPLDGLKAILTAVRIRVKSEEKTPSQSPPWKGGEDSEEKTPSQSPPWKGGENGEE